MKTKKLLVLAALGLMTLACEEQEPGSGKEPQDVNYTVIAEMDQMTGADGLLWPEGARVNAVAVNANNEAAVRELALTEGAGTDQGTFAGAIKDDETPYTLVYPSAVGVDTGKKKLVLPSVYGDAETDYTSNLNVVMAAYPGEDGTAMFVHLGGALKVSVNGIPANAKGVALTAEKGIAGPFDFDFDADIIPALVAEEAVEGSVSRYASVTFLFKPKSESRDEEFYFPLPVGSYQFGVEYINAEDERILLKSGDGSIQIGRSKLVELPPISISTEPAAKITFSDVTSTDAHIKIEPKSELYYYIQPFGKDVADMEEVEKMNRINGFVASTVASTVFMEAAGYDGSFLALYKKFMGETATFYPGQTYFVGVVAVPEESNTAPIAADVTYALVTFEGYEIGGDASNVGVTFESITETVSAVSVRIVPAENAEGMAFKCSYMDYDTYEAEYKDKGDEALLDFVAKLGEKKAETKLSVSPVEQGKSYMVVVYAYDPATAKGKVFTQKLSCPAIVFSEGVTLNMNVLYTGVNYAEVKIEPVGGELSMIRYGFMRKDDFEKKEVLMSGSTAVEAEMIEDKTVSQRRNINADNLAADHIYMIENLYLHTPDQYFFVIAKDKDGKWIRMVQTTIDTQKPFDERFDASLTAPDVKAVYYSTSTTGYKTALTESDSDGNPYWNKMSDITDPSTLNALTGMYWLDLDWGTPNPMKRMWLCNENTKNWNGNFALTGTDKKADAITVLKKRAGYTAYENGVTPDFYARTKNTGALLLTDVKVWNTSEYKSLRDKTDASNIKAKTLYLVWETTDGRYGYTSVVPEDYLGEASAE